MKQIISILLVLLISQVALSCESKSESNKTNAKCCAKKNPPSWCPEKPSEEEVDANISRISKSKKAMKFARKNSDGGESSGRSGEMQQSFFPGPGLGGGFGSFWPMHCPWWRWCCRYCYYRYLVFTSWPSWWRYMVCIWRRCH